MEKFDSRYERILWYGLIGLCGLLSVFIKF